MKTLRQKLFFYATITMSAVAITCGAWCGNYIVAGIGLAWFEFVGIVNVIDGVRRMVNEK